MVFSDVINVDSSCELYDEIQCQIERFVHFFVVSGSFLVGRVEDDVLDGGSFLMID